MCRVFMYIHETLKFKYLCAVAKSLVNISKSAHNRICDNLRIESQFKTRPVRTEYFGRQSLMYLGPKIWELPPNLRNLETVTAFKCGIKKLEPEKCPCRQCKTYLPQAGFT